MPRAREATLKILKFKGRGGGNFYLGPSFEIFSQKIFPWSYTPLPNPGYNDLPFDRFLIWSFWGFLSFSKKPLYINNKTIIYVVKHHLIKIYSSSNPINSELFFYEYFFFNLHLLFLMLK